MKLFHRLQDVEQLFESDKGVYNIKGCQGKGLDYSLDSVMVQLAHM